MGAPLPEQAAQLVLYRARLDAPGSLAATAAQAPRLARLGVTCLDLPPALLSRLPSDTAVDAPPAGLFAVEESLGGSGVADADAALVALLSAFHTVGCRVLAPLPLAHGCERVGGEAPCSLAGLDAPSYFLIGPAGELQPSPAAPPPGPAPNKPAPAHFNPCAAATQHLLLDAARLALGLRGFDGLSIHQAGAAARGPLGRPPLLEALALDAMVGGPHALSFYSGGGGEKLPHWGCVGEEAAGYGADVAAFAAGAPGALSRLAQRLCGSGSGAGPARGPRHVLNRLSPTAEASPERVRLLRLIQLVSVGLPVLEEGEEWGSGGAQAPAPWGASLEAFIAAATAARTRHARYLAPSAFPTPAGRGWFDAQLGEPAWKDAAAPAALAFGCPGGGSEEALVYVLLNASGAAVDFRLPTLPPGQSWRCLLDAAAPPPLDAQPRLLHAGETSLTVASPGGVLLERVMGEPPEAPAAFRAAAAAVAAAAAAPVKRPRATAAAKRAAVAVEAATE